MANFDRQLATQVVSILSAADLDFRPKIERRWLPKFELTDLTTPRIVVAPRTQTRSVASRSHWNRRHTIQVAVMAKVTALPGGQVDDGRVDRLVDLVETVIDTLCDASPFNGASVISAETDPMYDLEALTSPGVFRAVLTFTYSRTLR